MPNSFGPLSGTSGIPQITRIGEAPLELRDVDHVSKRLENRTIELLDGSCFAVVVLARHSIGHQLHAMGTCLLRKNVELIIDDGIVRASAADDNHDPARLKSAENIDQFFG